MHKLVSLAYSYCGHKNSICLILGFWERNGLCTESYFFYLYSWLRWLFRVLQKPKQTKHGCFTNCEGLKDCTREFYYLKNSNSFPLIYRVKALSLSMGYTYPRDLAADSSSKIPPKRAAQIKALCPGCSSLPSPGQCLWSSPCLDHYPLHH